MTPGRVLLRILGLTVLAAAGTGCTPTCEQAVARKNHALAATQCEKAYLSGHRPADALAALRALGQLGKNAEVGPARVAWLNGTPYAPAASFYLGLAARARGDDAEAQRQLEQCVGGAPAAGLHDFAARCARQLAAQDWIEGRFQAAFTHLALALTEVRQSDDPILEGMIYGQLADLLSEVGDEAGEGRALDAIAARFKPIFPGGYAQVRLRQGRLELNRGHPNIARDCFEEALALAADAGLSPVVRAAHIKLAEVARAVNDLDAGQWQLSAAAAIPARAGYEHTTLAFAEAKLLAQLGRWREAQTTVAAALDAGALLDWQWQLQSLQGECLEQLQQPAAARAAYQQATSAIDALRATALRPGLLADRRQPFEALFELHLREGEPRAALAMIDPLLGAAFAESLGAAHSPPADLETSARNALRRLTTLELLTRVRRAPAAPIAQILERLGKREVLAFLVARDHLYRVHLAAGKIDVQPLEPPARLRVLREQLDAHPDDREAAEALGRALWPRPAPGPEVLIVADPSLATLSFAGLRLGHRYLVEDHVLSYAPSLAVAAALQDRAPAGTGVVVLGDPKGDLPGAAAEAGQTARLLGGSLALGPDATRARLQSGCGAQLLHLAAHSGLGPDGAWLELSDGPLTAADVLAHRCGPASVYLASCASAASARKDGAGTLAGAFLSAGSRFVVATTRSIDDATAARFTRALFAEGKWDQLPARVATAQRALLKTAPRSQWEPFIVFGP